MKKFRSSGFTLVEIAVALSIISLLTTITFGSFKTVRERVGDTRTKADIEQIKFALETYYQEYGGYPNPSADLLGVNSADGRYCLGSDTCLLDDVQHADFLLKASSTIPKQNITNLVLYTFLGKKTQGYTYTCYDPLNTSVRPPAGPICPAPFKSYVFYGLNKPGGIQSHELGAEKSSTVTNVGTPSGCPYPGTKTVGCVSGTVAPSDPITTDPGPADSGSPPPTGSCAASVSGNVITWTASVPGATGAATYSWSITNPTTSGGSNVTRSGNPTSDTYTYSGTKSATVTVNDPALSATPLQYTCFTPFTYSAAPLTLSCSGTVIGLHQIRWTAIAGGAQGTVNYSWASNNGSDNFNSFGTSNTYVTTFTSSGTKVMDVSAYDSRGASYQVYATCSATAS